MKKLRSVTVRGKAHEWSIQTEATDATVADWEADGLEVITLAYVVPAWIVEAGLASLWMFFQDIWHLRNPFKEG